MESITIEPLVSVRTETNLNTPKQTQWRSCCFSINPQATKYIIQVGILSGLIICSATMLVVNPNCESQRNYSSLLLFCLGTLTPSPRMS